MGKKNFEKLILYLILPSCIILSLILIYLLPPEIKDSLTLKHHDFSLSSWFNLYTYHFVHFDYTHLLGNLITFSIVYWLLAYLVQRGREVKTFSIMVLIIFFIIAPFLGIITIKFLNLPVKRSLGFSGMVMAFTGLIPYFSFRLLVKELGISFRASYSHLMFLLIAYGIAVFYINKTLAIVFILAGSWTLAFYTIRTCRNKIEDTRETRKLISLVFSSLMIFVLVVSVCFPENVKASFGIVNIFGHFLGLYLSMVLLYFVGLVEESKDRQS